MYTILTKSANRADVTRHSSVDIGERYYGSSDNMPEIGKRFKLVNPDGALVISTSEVTELLPHNCFKTKHSIYQYRHADEDIHTIMEGVKNVLDNSEGLEVEVLAFAFEYLKSNPTATVDEALEHGFGEWVK